MSQTTSDLKYILMPMRLPFLFLTPACVSVGIGTAIFENGRVDPFQALLVLIGGIAAHISVNALNEYFDFRSGLDMTTRRTPFSGGSGGLPARPDLAPAALVTGLATLGIVLVIGLYFILERGLWLLPVGLFGAFLVVTYTLWWVRNPLLSLVAPGLGFGPLMVLGAHFALTGYFSINALLASMVPFFLVSDLLLLNQFPDVDPDAAIGRKHFPILIGRRASALIYTLFVVLAYLAIIIGVAARLLPTLALIGLGTVPLAVPACLGAIRNADNLPALAPSMGMNVLINILTPALMAVGLIFG